MGEEMKTRSIDMTRGPIVPSLILFAIPMLLSGLLQICFNTADTIVVGRFAGHASMAAIGSTSSLTNLLINLFMGISIGVNVVVARSIGAGDKEGTEKAVNTAVAVAIISGLFLSVVGYFLSPKLLSLMGTPPDIMDKSVLYMRIIFMGQVFNLLYNFGSAILRSDGDTRRPLGYLTLAGVVNVVLNLFFVVVLKKDVSGVAAATVISTALSAFLVMRALTKGEGRVKVTWKKLGIDRRKLLDILHMGVPAGLQTVIFSISNVLIQSSVNTFGSFAVAGNTAANSLDGFMYTVSNCLVQANLSFVSQNYGAGKKERIKPIMRSSLMITVLSAAVLGTLCLKYGNNILSLYSSEAKVMEFGLVRVRYVLTVYFIFAFEEMMVSCIRGLGFSVAPMFISIFTICGVRILWIFTVFARWRTFPSIFVAYPISWTIAAICHTILFLYIWKRRNPLEKIGREVAGD